MANCDPDDRPSKRLRLDLTRRIHIASGSNGRKNPSILDNNAQNQRVHNESQERIFTSETLSRVTSTKIFHIEDDGLLPVANPSNGRQSEDHGLSHYVPPEKICYGMVCSED